MEPAKNVSGQYQSLSVQQSSSTSGSSKDVGESTPTPDFYLEQVDKASLRVLRRFRNPAEASKVMFVHRLELTLGVPPRHKTGLYERGGFLWRYCEGSPNEPLSQPILPLETLRRVVFCNDNGLNTKRISLLNENGDLLKIFRCSQSFPSQLLVLHHVCSHTIYASFSPQISKLRVCRNECAEIYNLRRLYKAQR